MLVQTETFINLRILDKFKKAFFHANNKETCVGSIDLWGFEELHIIITASFTFRFIEYEFQFIGRNIEKGNINNIQIVKQLQYFQLV